MYEVLLRNKHFGLTDLKPGTFTPWEDIEANSDMLFYEGLHGMVKHGDIDVGKYVDVGIGVVPVVNLEWIQKIHRDNKERGYSAEVYQVQVDHTRKAMGAEALIRWQHPELGFVSPAQFIPLAEETGLILPIGQWVLETACEQLKAWQNNGLTRKLTLSVNVSAKQFHETKFVKQVQDAVKNYAIDPALLKLEPTESVLLENIDDTVETMNALKAIGVHFALDDFGTGFSSLQYLKKLPLNQLKIDQTFVRELVTDNNDQAIVRTIIAMAQSMDLQVIAEGVETEEQLQLLLQSGCNHYQGFLFGKPVPIEEFEASLNKG